VRIAGGKVEVAVGADGSGRTSSDTKLAFQARVVIDWLRIGADFGIE
jgi:hypothetical protein